MLFTTLILILKTIYKFAYLSCFIYIHIFFNSIVKQDKYIDYVFCIDDICALIKFVIEKYMLQANVLDFPQKTKESNWPFYSTITVEM